MAIAVIYLLEFVQVDVQHGELCVLALNGVERSFQLIVKQIAIGQVRELVVAGDVVQPRVSLLAFDRRGHLGGNELQEQLVLFPVAHITCVALHDQRTDRALLRGERHADPVHRSATSAVAADAVRQRPRAAPEQQRLATAHYRRRECPGVQFAWGWRFVVSVDKVGKAQLIPFGVIQCHEEIPRREQLADDGVNTLEQRQQVGCGMRRLGNGVQRRLHGFGMFQFGDIACHGNTYLVRL